MIVAHLELLYVNAMFSDENKRLVDYLDELQALRRIEPMCTDCKSIRDAEETWRSLDKYLSQNPKVGFSHPLCESRLAKV